MLTEVGDRFSSRFFMTIGKKGGKKDNQKGGSGKASQMKEEEEEVTTEINKGSGPPKRGQKGKMKKREKYRDQDEEERNLRMSLLQVCVFTWLCFTWL